MPERIGQYDAERVLGSGAFATVWLAHDARLDGDVALKVLADNWARDDDVRRRFLDEARVLWRLDSDRAIRVHAVDELEDGRPYFVMDYADRGSLADRMKQRAEAGQRYSEAEALAVSLDIADALAVVHRLGVVHRDLKPSNVLYRTVASHHGDTRAERMVLADFGVARALDAATAFTIAAGTPHYMAPEQMDGHADERSDVYAAAVVLYELLAGRVPYPYESVGAVMRAQLSETPPPISSLRDDISPALDAVLARGLAADANERYASASDWSEVLRGVEGAVAVGTLDGEGDRATAETVIRPAGAAAGAAAGGAGVAATASSGGGAAGPPTAPTPAAPGGASPPPSNGAKRRRNQRVVALLIILFLVGGVAAVAVFSSGDEAAAGEIFLDPRDATSVGNSGPFTAPSINPNVVVPQALATNPDAVPPPQGIGGGTPSVVGGEPGLYGGTRDSTVCDPAKLVSFLNENAEKAKAWAETIGIPVSQIQSYVSGLTSVLLRADTRVTNHGFANGAATAVQSVLEAGSAVLVDKFGVPKVKCYCGNPLLEPEPVQSKPEYSGTPWPTFEPTVVQVVQPAPQPVTVIVLVDVNTGQPFGRPVGTDGGSDENATLPPRGTGTSTTTTRPQSTTTTRPATTTTSGGGNSTTAVKLMRDALQACIDSVATAGSDDSTTADDLNYEVTSEGGGVFTVTVSERDGPDRGAWRVDTRTGDFTPQDQTASEVGGFCPALS